MIRNGPFVSIWVEMTTFINVELPDPYISIFYNLLPMHTISSGTDTYTEYMCIQAGYKKVTIACPYFSLGYLKWNST